MTRADVTVAILAGGRSSRMGTDKALVMFGARSLGDIACALACEISDDVRVLGHGRGLPEHLPRIDDVGVDQGPLGGIAALAAEDVRSCVLVLPIDMPRLQPPDLAELLEALARAPAAAFSDHPLPFALQRAALAGVPTHGALTAALQQIGVRWVTAPNPERLANLNTPADLEQR